jgi:hypothetical protein
MGSSTMNRDVPQSYCLPQRKKNGGTSPSVLEMRGYGKALQVLPGGAKVEGKRAVERLMARGHSAGAAALLAEAEEDPGTDVVAGDSVDVFEEVLSDESPTKRAPRRRKRSE